MSSVEPVASGGDALAGDGTAPSRRGRARVAKHARVIRSYVSASRNPADLFRLLRARYTQPGAATIRVGARQFGDLIIRPRPETDISVVGEIIAGAYDVAVGAAGDGQVVDLGAHIGLVSRLCVRRLPGATVVAVEGNPKNVPILRQNAPDVTVIDRPIAASRRRVTMTDERLDGCRIVDDADGVETITMEDIPGRIALLKVDIEGTERELFASCRDWIDRVGVIVCECHHPYTASDMLAALRTAGREPVVLDVLEHPQFGYDLVTARI